MKKIAEIQICEDCLIVVDGDPSMGAEETQRYCAEAAEGLARNWPGLYVHGTGEEGKFSWSGCDGCGSTDGGKCYPAVVLGNE